jgi:hypothetical protein
LIEGTQLVEKWYPQRIFSYLNKDEIEKFWNDYDLEHNDWFGNLFNSLNKQSFNSLHYRCNK